MTEIFKGALSGAVGYLWARRLAIVIAAVPVVLFAFTVGTYYGYYYDNKFFNLLALELWDDFGLYLYLGSHYHVPSALYSYLVYPLFFVFGPGDVAMEVSAVIFHVLTVLLCLKLGERLYGRAVGAVFALLVGYAPIQVIQVYTIPDLSFAIFLNVLAFYLFLTGIEDPSGKRVVASAVVYSLVCFQAIYYLLLLPFFVVYCLVRLCKRAPAVGPLEATSAPAGRAKKAMRLARLFCAAPALAYLLMLFFVSFGSGLRGAITAGALVPAAAAFVYFKRPSLAHLWTSLSFVVVSLSLLAYYDLVVQLDYHKFGRAFEYALNAAPAGGYDGRPAAHFMGKEVFIGGTRIYMSVLTSIFQFAGQDIAKVSAFNTEGLWRLYHDYYLLSYPPAVRALSYAGAVSIAALGALAYFKEGRVRLVYLFPLVWLFAVMLPFVNLGPSYFNIRRVYVAPFPYLFAALGVVGAARAGGYAISYFGPLKARRRAVAAALTVGIALFVSADQGAYLKRNVYDRYWRDKSADMYYKLYYGHFYGRSYKELGAFLLKDAPLKKDGQYRAMLVYTIPEDSRVGRSLPLFNTINWYTRNQLEVVFDFKGGSSRLYGTGDLLKGYLERIFDENPAILTVYFADFVDTENGFSYFSKAHPGIKPYRVVDDDGIGAFDALVYRFDRGSWMEKLTN